MIQTVVTPQKKNFDMSVSLPDDYVGKEIHVLFYNDEDVKKQQLLFYQRKSLRIFLVRLAKKMAKKCRHT